MPSGKHSPTNLQPNEREAGKGPEVGTRAPVAAAAQAAVAQPVSQCQGPAWFQELDLMAVLPMAPPRVGQWMAMGQPGKANRSQL